MTTLKYSIIYSLTYRYATEIMFRSHTAENSIRAHKYAICVNLHIICIFLTGAVNENN